MGDHASMQRDVAERQVAMFASFVGRGCYITRAALAAASKIPESTLREWAGGAAMPLSAALTLRRHLPAEAVNMLTEPGDARLVGIEQQEANWDAIAAGAAGLTFEICDARKDGTVDHVERARLRARARGLIAELSDVVGED
jgi:hypothetical protein